jgi:hypothetical protein
MWLCSPRLIFQSSPSNTTTLWWISLCDLCLVTFLYNSIYSKNLRLEFFFDTFQNFPLFSYVYVRITKIDVKFKFVSCWGIFFFFSKGFGGGVYLLVPFFCFGGKGGGGFCLPTSYSLFFCMGALSPVEVNLPLCLTS